AEPTPSAGQDGGTRAPGTLGGHSHPESGRARGGVATGRHGPAGRAAALAPFRPVAPAEPVRPLAPEHFGGRRNGSADAGTPHRGPARPLCRLRRRTRGGERAGLERIRDTRSTTAVRSRLKRTVGA